MNDDPLFQLLMLGAGIFVFKLWNDDRRAFMRGQPNSKALPGAAPANRRALSMAIGGTCVLLAAETWGEIQLGIADQQSKMTALFALCTLSAAIVEEIIFRGFLVLEKYGRSVLWIGIIFTSLIFAILHQHLGKWEGGLPWSGGRMEWTFTTKGWFSTAALFVGSLWFYWLRYAAFNPTRSLFPCFAAHFSKNLGVIFIKFVQGHLVGW